MGSCTSCLFSSTSSPQLMVRILLVNGHVLKFKAPLRVIELLAEYPNHAICCLSSLSPGLHSLSPLLPHEKLRLGGLYLMLPLKSLAQAAHSIRPMKQNKASNDGLLQTNFGDHCLLPRPGLPTRKPNLGLPSSAKSSRNDGPVMSDSAAFCHNGEGMDCARPRKEPPTQKSKGGMSGTAAFHRNDNLAMAGSAEFCRNGVVGTRSSNSEGGLSKNCRVASQVKQQQARRHSISAEKGIREREAQLRRRGFDDEQVSRSEHRNHDKRDANGSMRAMSLLCESPHELHNLSVLRRRSSTSRIWSPTLQPIHERR